MATLGRRDDAPLGASGLTPDELHALLAVVGDLADDLDVRCAAVVLDADGAVQAAERAADVPPRLLEQATAAARSILGGVDPKLAPGGGDSSAVLLVDRLTDTLRGAVGVAGGPAGFAAEASRSAADALGLL